MSHVDSTSPVTHVSLCAGYGGIDLGLHRAIRNLRTIAVSEIEAFACANLVAKMEAGLLDPAPIWTDLKTFPWAEFRDRVDILSGGYPCQPFSAAGKRLGAEDPRHLWPFISAGIAAMRPSVCFFENVEGHISLGLSDVLQDLAGLGYRATWCVASASECGAPHQRKRIWILAERNDQRSSLAGLWQQSKVAVISDNAGEELAHRHGERGQLPDWWREPAEQVPVGYGETWRDESGELADTTIWRRDRQHAGCSGDVGEWSAPQDVRPEAAHAGGGRTTQAWPSRPGELANANPGRQPSGVHTGSGSKEIGRGQVHIVTPCGVWPSRPGEQQFAWDDGSLANAQLHGRDHANARPNADGIQGPLGQGHEHRQALGDGQLWPSRPGEQQHAWEPPRVVLGNASNARHTGQARSSGKCAQGQSFGHTAESDGGLGNAAHTNRRSRVSAEEAGAGPDDIWRRRSGESGEREIIKPMGLHLDGAPDGLGVAELSGLSDQELAEIRHWMVASDNRTDELRLLGNGVVPACAERAFRLLFGELMEATT